MLRFLRVFGAVGLLSAAAACSAPTSPTDAIEVRPSGTLFTRTGQGQVADVPYTVVNTGARPALVTSRCGERLQLAVEQRQGTAWVEYASGACLAIYPMSPVSLAAGGGTRASTAGIRDAGTYRLIVATDRGPVTSVAFTVR